MAARGIMGLEDWFMIALIKFWFRFWMSFWTCIFVGIAILAIPALVFKIFDPGDKIYQNQKKHQSGVLNAALYSEDVNVRSGD